MSVTPAGRPVPQLEWTPEAVSRFWDWQSQFPENYFGVRYGLPVVDLMTRLANPPRMLLDFACGPGSMVKPLLAAGYNVTACDISPASVAKAAEKGKGHPSFGGAYRPDDLARLGRRYDAAILSEVVEHVDDFVLTQILSDLARFLTPKALLLITTPNDEDLAQSTVFCPCCNHEFHRWQHVRSWTASTLSAHVEAAGFALRKTGTTDFGYGVEANHLRRSLRKLRDRLAGKKPPHLWAVFEWIG